MNNTTTRRAAPLAEIPRGSCQDITRYFHYDIKVKRWTDDFAIREWKIFLNFHCCENENIDNVASGPRPWLMPDDRTYPSYIIIITVLADRCYCNKERLRQKCNGFSNRYESNTQKGVLSIDIIICVYSVDCVREYTFHCLCSKIFTHTRFLSREYEYFQLE